MATTFIYNSPPNVLGYDIFCHFIILFIHDKNAKVSKLKCKCKIIKMQK